MAHQIENLHSVVSPQPNEKISHTEFAEIQRQLRKIYVYGESGRYRFSISLISSVKYRI